MSSNINKFFLEIYNLPELQEIKHSSLMEDVITVKLLLFCNNNPFKFFFYLLSTFVAKI